MVNLTVTGLPSRMTSIVVGLPGPIAGRKSESILTFSICFPLSDSMMSHLFRPPFSAGLPGTTAATITPFVTFVPKDLASSGVMSWSMIWSYRRCSVSGNGWRSRYLCDKCCRLTVEILFEGLRELGGGGFRCPHPEDDEQQGRDGEIGE